MNEEVIVTCAVTGAGDTVGRHPAIPVASCRFPAEVAPRGTARSPEREPAAGRRREGRGDVERGEDAVRRSRPVAVAVTTSLPGKSRSARLKRCGSTSGVSCIRPCMRSPLALRK